MIYYTYWEGFFDKSRNELLSSTKLFTSYSDVLNYANTRANDLKISIEEKECYFGYVWLGIAAKDENQIPPENHRVLATWDGNNKKLKITDKYYYDKLGRPKITLLN